MAKEIEVLGLRELRAAMKELPLALEDKALRGMLMAGAKPALDAAKSLAVEAQGVIQTQVKKSDPIADIEPGRLRNNIARRGVRNPQQHDAEVQMYVRSSRRKLASDPRNAWFWFWVELGTSKYAAKPFMRPAFEMTKERAVRIIAKDGWKKIRLQAKKLNARGRQRVMRRLGK